MLNINIIYLLFFVGFAHKVCSSPQNNERQLPSNQPAPPQFGLRSLQYAPSQPQLPAEPQPAQFNVRLAQPQEQQNLLPQQPQFSLGAQDLSPSQLNSRETLPQLDAGSQPQQPTSYTFTSIRFGPPTPNTQNTEAIARAAPQIESFDTPQVPQVPQTPQAPQSPQPQQPPQPRQPSQPPQSPQHPQAPQIPSAVYPQSFATNYFNPLAQQIPASYSLNTLLSPYAYNPAAALAGNYPGILGNYQPEYAAQLNPAQFAEQGSFLPGPAAPAPDSQTIPANQPGDLLA